MLVTVTYPDGSTQITAKDSEGRVLSVTGTAQPSRFYHYTPRAGEGGLITTIYYGEDLGARFERTITDAAGRVIQTIRPGFKGTQLAQTDLLYASGNAPRSLPQRVSRSGQAHEITTYNAVGARQLRGQSADDTSLTLSSATDRISEEEYAYESDANGFWQVSSSFLYPEANSAARKLIATSREKLAGFSGTEVSRSEQIDLLGNVTTSVETLDGALRTVTTTRPGASEAEISISHAGLRMSLQQPGISGLTLMGYDALGREVSRKEPRQSTASATGYFAGKNQVETETDAAGNVTRYSYYPQGSMGAGKVRSITLPDATVAYRAYTACGDLRASWGSQTNPTWYEYDRFCQMTELHTWQTNPNFSVDALPATRPAGSAKTTWNYDAASGLLLSKLDAESKGASYLYDVAGRLKERLWARGVNTVYGYDGFGQLKTTDYSDSTPDVTLSYDRLGRQSSLGNGVANSVFSYDSTTLRLSSETITYELPWLSITRVLDRSQDALGRNEGWNLKEGENVEHSAAYSYSASSGRMEMVSSGDLRSPISYGYQANSNLLESVTGPAHTVSNTYEPNRDVLDVKENRAGSTVISRYDYAMNGIGQRTNLAQSGTAFSSSRSIAWGYDSLGQVTSADSTISSHTRTYQFDMIGNRLQGSAGVSPASITNFTANALNQYTAVGAINPVYDDDGNATAYPLPANVNANSSLVWDGENRLISATVNGVETQYFYDAYSRCICTTQSPISNPQSTLYIYDSWNPIAEYVYRQWTGNTNPAQPEGEFNTESLITGWVELSKTYTWGLDLSGTLQGAGGVAGLLAVSDSSGTYFPTYDGNGNVSEYLDSTGAIAAHYEYDPFGRTMVSTGAKANEFAHRFSTKPIDATTGLYYYGYRFYDPETGRWLNRDPLGEEGGVNLYGFVGNAGVGKWDLLGMVACNPGEVRDAACTQGCLDQLRDDTENVSDGFFGRAFGWGAGAMLAGSRSGPWAMFLGFAGGAGASMWGDQVGGNWGMRNQHNANDDNYNNCVENCPCVCRD